jgi:predicted enzyme related to lactoylglutathione lyase
MTSRRDGTIGDTGTIDSAVPVLRVASVVRSMAWYSEVLGFTGDSVGTPNDPVFAIIRRDGVHLMLQKVQGGFGTPSRGASDPDRGWDVYLRIDDAEAFREAIRTRIPGIGPIEDREYGCREITVTDPDGHVIVLGECG